MPIDVRVEAYLPQVDALWPSLATASDEISKALISITGKRQVRAFLQMGLLLAVAILFWAAVYSLSLLISLQHWFTGILCALLWIWILSIVLLGCILSLELVTEYVVPLYPHLREAMKPFTRPHRNPKPRMQEVEFVSRHELESTSAVENCLDEYLERTNRS
ncbi:hypothetical protein GMRT_15186 [Giardia muris]|uniref:Uncharacterized protein n=1 Tax=Giardia muris TaxID=5742 RepID=A0A4Z1T2F8_GIAMU|nr:hypothetical protein GMRT_15186 [Giardia muris]|eukprot:TNJ28123.1 hypothetical protein GMRT_15186 [Giardia muris]